MKNKLKKLTIALGVGIGMAMSVPSMALSCNYYWSKCLAYGGEFCHYWDEHCADGMPPRIGQ